MKFKCMKDNFILVCIRISLQSIVHFVIIIGVNTQSIKQPREKDLSMQNYYTGILGMTKHWLIKKVK